MGVVHKFGTLCCLVAVATGFASCRKIEFTSILPDSGKDGESVVRILTWKGLLSEQVVRDFTWETGIKVDKFEFSGAEEMVAQLRAYPHRYDLVVAESSSVQRLAKQKLLRQIESEKLPAIDELMPEVLNRMPEEVLNYSIPYHWGTTIIAYRKDKVKDPRDSIDLLFDPQLKGKVLLLDNPFECLGLIHLKNGRSINSYAEEEIENASDELNKLAKQCDIRFASSDTITTKLTEGSYWAGLCYSGDCARMAERDSRIAYFVPREGAGMWLDVIGLSRDVENVDEAYGFLSYLLRPACMATSAEELKYPTPYPASWDNVDAAFFENKLLWPGEKELENYELFGPRPLLQFSRISRRFSEVTRGRLLHFKEEKNLSINTGRESGHPVE